MRTKTIFFGSLFSIFTTFVISAADELPQRRAGLWEMKTTLKGTQQPAPSAKQCIDAATDAQMREMAQGNTGSICTEQATKKVGDTYVTDSVCSMKGSTVVSHAVISGDFASKYTVEASASMEPPLMGQSKSDVVVEATYLGECEAGQKPGDIIMPNGKVMNISDIKRLTKSLNQP